ncbi:DEAD/DEAH box helicase family protein [Haloferula sp. A504]|uniref:restriction endonuclease n=1 Tax=Haloferula sp. A504 TaxID=3373601 RepID=UPI0031CBAA36|nr:DEAD/DEAH box helicase family protein [Verrucomicrobiaceae bacterium E54]
MKFQFDAHLPHQTTAIDAVLGLFEGSEAADSRDVATAFQTFDTELFRGTVQTPMGVGNAVLARDGLLQRIRAVQERNGIEPSPSLGIRYADSDGSDCPHFSIEMETGTGKTYVYLRTLFELHRHHGFAKFIIVVPSVAIREGTLKTLEMTREHFRSLYDQVPYDFFVYDSKKLGKIRQFASSNQLQIMVINIDAFRGKKDSRIFNDRRDQLSGHKPSEFVASANPIVIIDEPQSVDNTPASQKAILSLNPLCTLRYSATHRNPYHLLYRLDPVQAYDRHLVKGIDVSSSYTTGTTSQADPFLKVEKVDLREGGGSIRAKVRLLKAGSSKTSLVTIKKGDNLQSKAGGNEAYSGNWIVREINAAPGSEYIEFANSRAVALDDELGGSNDEILREQIRETVKVHAERLNQLAPKGIKVLSLFFIDKVANYRERTSDGTPLKGRFAEWLEETYREIAAHPVLGKHLNHPAETVHDGYFSGDKSGWKDTSGTTKADTDTYELIMKDKERLLSPAEPRQFIFSHSALKEGWDNPNVFQICTLREMGTDTERRQTLGRGLRLARDAEGAVIHDPQVNRLTVVCNERFEDYAKALQSDIADASGIEFGKVKPDAFRELVRPGESDPIGKDASRKLWDELKSREYLTVKGEVTDRFTPDQEGFVLDTSDEFRDLRPQVIDLIRHMSFTSRIRNRRERRRIRLNKAVQLTPEFEELWRRISQRTKYAVEFSTDALIASAVEEMRKIPDIPEITIATSKTQVELTEGGVRGTTVRESTAKTLTNTRLPDILGHLQSETRLTRATLARILIDSDRLADFLKNPSVFSTWATKAVNKALSAIVDDGVTYHRVNGLAYEQRLFDEDDSEEITAYASRLYEVQNKSKALYDVIEWESEIEKDFAKALDAREEVKLFFKLPRWFKIPTPVGPYNPDWAIVTGDENKVYLVRETKSTSDPNARRDRENQKIKFGKRHFEALSAVEADAVDFRDCVTLREALASLERA